MSKEIILTINGRDYKVRYTLRAMFIHESITGRPFEIATLLDNYIFFYSLILASNPDGAPEWDEFIQALDDDPALTGQLNRVIEEWQKRDSVFEKEENGQKKS